MQIAGRWLAIGAIALIGSLWFVSRVLLVLDLANRIDAWWYVLAFAIGGLAGGAVIARHSTARAWCEPVIAAVLACAFLVALARFGRDANSSITGPVAIMSSVQVSIACMLALIGAYAGALLGRRVTTEPSLPAIVVLSGLLICGAMMVTMGIAAALSGSHRFSGWIVPLAFASVAAGGFATQAVVAQRRPWACASGGLLLFLIMVQKDGADSVVVGAFAVGMLTLIAWFGARIAVRVFRDRWTSASPSIPTARVES